MIDHLAFILFLVLTLTRQVPQLLRWCKKSTLPGDQNSIREDIPGTVGLYLLYMVIWIYSGFILFSTNPSSIAVPIGLVFIAMGTIVRFIAMKDLGAAYSSIITIRRNQVIVSNGIYSLVRHPMHLGLLIETAGMATTALALPVFPFWLVLALVIVRRNNLEDEVIHNHFGRAGAKYQSKVPAMNILASLLRKMGKERRSGIQETDSA